MDILVEPDPDGSPGGWRLTAGGQSWPCAIGARGVIRDKREGDHATPLGCWPVRRLLYRQDRGGRPETALPAEPISPKDGWSDDPERPEYNQPVTLPYEGRHERMWRQDRLYDLVVVLGYNDDPPKPGVGSAIFLHCAQEDYAPTHGCVALKAAHLRVLLTRLAPGDRLCVKEEAGGS